MISNIHDLIAFLRSFHRSWLDSPGLDHATLPPGLPYALAYLYRDLGALVTMPPGRGDGRTPFAAQDALLPPDRLKVIDGMVEFACENQGNWTCRYPIGTQDPPVYSDAPDLWNSPPRGFQKVCDSLEHFLITLSLQEAVMSAPVLLTIEADSFEAALATPIKPLWLRGWYVNGEPTHDYYVVPEHDLLLFDYPGKWIATHDERNLSVVDSRIRSNRID